MLSNHINAYKLPPKELQNLTKQLTSITAHHFEHALLKFC